MFSAGVPQRILLAVQSLTRKSKKPHGEEVQSLLEALPVNPCRV